MVTTTNFFLYHFRLHVYSDHLQVDHCLGNLKRHFSSSFDYRTNDRIAFGHGLNRRQTFVGLRIAIGTSIQFTDDLLNMRSLDVDTQATASLLQNEIYSHIQTFKTQKIKDSIIKLSCFIEGFERVCP